MSADWAYLSALMPGETVYSWCGAQHTFRAGKSAFESSQGLLGYGHGPRQHDLPAGLSKLPIFQPPYSLRIERVLKQHTVGGYYWPWLSEHARTQVLQDCADGNSTHWRRALVAMSRSRPFQHALRWCPECAETDLAQHGRAYWHVEHQSPIARACRNHRKLLQVIPSPRKTWALVPDALSASAPAAHQSALVLAQLSETICSMASINVNCLRGAVVLRLQETGVTASTRGVLHEALEKWFSTTELAKWCQADGHGFAHLANGKWIAGMLWRQRRSHPVLWPVLWAALHWSNPDEATTAFEDAASGRVRWGGGQITLFGEHADLPMSAPEHVRSALMRANSYQDVMQQLGVSRGRIIRWLELDPDLRSEWKAQLRAGHQAQCEQVIRDTVLECNVATRADLESKCAAEVRWMREHAPAKLAAMLRSMPARLAVQPTLFEGDA